MVTIDIKENIRFFKPNDPYYYEVDNLPLIDLLNNDKILRDEINFILAANNNFATEGYVQTNLQNAIGSAGIIDIDGDGSLPTNVIAWVIAQGYLSEVATNIGDLLDVDTASNTPVAGNSLIYDGSLTKWVPGGSEIIQKELFLGEFGGYAQGLGGSGDRFERANAAATTSLNQGVHLPKGHYRFDFTSSRGWTNQYIYHFAQDIEQIIHGYNNWDPITRTGDLNNTLTNGDASLRWSYNAALRFKFDDWQAGMTLASPSTYIQKPIFQPNTVDGNSWNHLGSTGVPESHLNLHHLKMASGVTQEILDGHYYFTVEEDVNEIWFTHSHHVDSTSHYLQFEGFRGKLYYLGGYSENLDGSKFSDPFPPSYASWSPPWGDGEFTRTQAQLDSLHPRRGA